MLKDTNTLRTNLWAEFVTSLNAWNFLKSPKIHLTFLTLYPSSTVPTIVTIACTA